jgi:hypothetical protein
MLHTTTGATGAKCAGGEEVVVLNIICGTAGRNERKPQHKPRTHESRCSPSSGSGVAASSRTTGNCACRQQQSDGCDGPAAARAR